MELKIITIEEATDPTHSLFKKKSETIKFPLSPADKQLIKGMQELLFKLNGVGLAAPQVNVGKSIAVIYIPESAALLRDNIEMYPMHTIINPQYTPIHGNEMESDFEGCYSVASVYGKVSRYKTINLKYQNEAGKAIEQIATGFYARVLQHEIDHLNGLLITDRLTPECVQGTFAEMLDLRRAELSKDKQKLFDELMKTKGIVKDEA